MISKLTFRLRNCFAAILIPFLFVTISCSAPKASSSAPPSQKPPPQPAMAHVQVRYIVQLVDPPLAGYDGGIPDLAPTNPSISGHGLDQQSKEARAYLDYLEEKQTNFRKKAEQLLTKEVVFHNQFRITLNAVVMTMTPDEALKIADLPDVRNVQPDRQMKLHSNSPEDVHGTLE